MPELKKILKIEFENKYIAICAYVFAYVSYYR